MLLKLTLVEVVPEILPPSVKSTHTLLVPTCHWKLNGGVPPPIVTDKTTFDPSSAITPAGWERTIGATGPVVPLTASTTMRPVVGFCAPRNVRRTLVIVTLDGPFRAN